MSFAFNCASVDKMLFIKIILILILFHCCFASTGLLWDKHKRDFISILKIPSYEEIYEESHRKIRNVAHQNLQGRVIKFGYYNVSSIFYYNSIDLFLLMINIDFNFRNPVWLNLKIITQKFLLYLVNCGIRYQNFLILREFTI